MNSEWEKRRKELMRQIGPNDIVVLPSATEMIRSGDAVYAFRQQSDFYYLTGFNEPDAVMVLAPQRPEGEYILFNRVRDQDREIWDGARAGQEGACKNFQANQAFPRQDFSSMLPEILVGRETIHYPMGNNIDFDKTVLKAMNKLRGMIRSGVQSPIRCMDISPTIHEMRLIKNKNEIAMIQYAIDISVGAHERAMKTCEPDLYEYELEAELMYEFYRRGSRYPAYQPIVGSGANTCTLHYVQNNKKINDGELVLIDAGAEYENYVADITRTFPANGRFSKEQREVYEIVLAAQLAAIKTIKPGTLWTKAQDEIVKILTQGLVDLKILKGNVNELIERQAYVPFYMHRSGHWLGLDVHDVGQYKIKNKWRTLTAGMVLTVEPGIYISADTPGVHHRWHNMGVRIEDDVLVTNQGCKVLSQALAKTADDIEALMK